MAREAFVARADVVARGMMGYPCLWRSGAFFAGFETSTGCLVVKLPEDRCEALLAGGVARPFRPRGTPFREWVLIPSDDGERWGALLDQAYAFAGGDG